MATDLRPVAIKLKELYVDYPNKYLEQYKDSRGEAKYRTIKAYKPGNKLDEPALIEHLRGNKTYGILLDPKTNLTRFMTFDVDIEGNDRLAKEVTQDIVTLLVQYYGIPREEIHISYSGVKGYHIDLFFDKSVDFSVLVPFYEEVLEKLRIKKESVELRPTRQGVKIPLSLHKKNSKFCSYIKNYRTLELLSQEEALEYVMNITPMSFEDFEEFVLNDIEEDNEKKKSFSIAKEKATDLITVADEVTLSGRITGDQRRELTEVALKGRLTFPGSRNRVSWLLPIFYKEQGYPVEDAIDFTQNVISNTFENYRSYIDKDTKLNFALSEVERLAKQAYEKDYHLTDSKRDVEFTKKEVLELLEVRELHLKKLLFSLMVQSKRYADNEGVFYTAYSTLEKMGNAKDRTKVLKYLLTLQERKLLRIVSRGETDEIRTKAEGRLISKPNQYKVLIAEPETEEEKSTLLIRDDEGLTMQKVVQLFIPEQEAKEKLPRKQWENHFRDEYREAK